MNKPIYLIGGGKGGVGKTFGTMAVIDTLLSLGTEDIIPIESDTSNPDIYKMYHKQLPCELLDLDKAEGWIDLVNISEQNPNHTIVINTASRNNKGVVSYSSTLQNTLGELNRKLITFWMINRQRDSIELLKEYLEIIPSDGQLHSLHVLKNNYFGTDEKFELYNGSKIRKEIESAGGLSLSFPEVADRISDDLYSKRLSINRAIEILPLGNRAELIRWQKIIHNVLGGVLNEH